VSVFCDQINTLVRRVVAGYVAKIATDALLLVNARNSAEGKVELMKSDTPMQTATHHVGDRCEAFLVHPIG